MAVASLAWELTCDTLMALTRAPDAGPLVVLATTRCRADQLPAGVSDCFYSAQVRVLRRVRARARSQVARLRARLSEAVCCVCLCAGWDVAGMGPFVCHVAPIPRACASSANGAHTCMGYPFPTSHLFSSGRLFAGDGRGAGDRPRTTRGGGSTRGAELGLAGETLPFTGFPFRCPLQGGAVGLGYRDHCHPPQVGGG